MSFFSIRSILHPYVDVLQGDLCEEGLKKKARSCEQDCLIFSTADSTVCVPDDVCEPAEAKMGNI